MGHGMDGEDWPMPWIAARPGLQASGGGNAVEWGDERTEIEKGTKIKGMELGKVERGADAGKDGSVEGRGSDVTEDTGASEVKPGLAWLDRSSGEGGAGGRQASKQASKQARGEDAKEGDVVKMRLGEGKSEKGRFLGGNRTLPVRAVEAGPFLMEVWIEEVDAEL